ncbi:MAG: 3-phosphoshikimate 1-carboxyvinyltransferase [Acidobacteriaceae bacterium]|jgi:3-phosphoshikimate 1-carboxyvinyltransferase|nr:3-phosphoshikimate 1-carboxyvinyltransferase [Acidobacteriaceae bacterium]
MRSQSVATVMPARRIHGRVQVPGDKSISHRYALFAALSEGRSTLTNYSTGADCHSTLGCLRGLGTGISTSGTTVTVSGRGLHGFAPPSSPLDCGNSGTTMRMLVGVLAAQRFSSELIGDASLSLRPMRRIIEPVSLMGARIESLDGHAPLLVHGGTLHAAHITGRVASAQVKSAVVLAGLHTEGVTRFTELAQTRDHTERGLRAFGFHVDVDGLTVSIAGGQRGSGQDLPVPGDFSSAAFWLVAAASLPGSRVVIEQVGLNPTRTALLDVLQRFGAQVTVEQTGGHAGEPIGTVTVVGDRTGSVEIAPDEVPALIDELPAVAALAAHGGEVTVRGAAELRVKESDRITTLVTGFRNLGIDADEHADGFVIHGGGAPTGGVANAREDHRMAMAFAVAALAARTSSRIEGADSVAISYPSFFETLERLVA